MAADPRPGAALEQVLAAPGRAERLTHVEHVPPRPARHAPWPAWAEPALVEGLRSRGVERPWSHQVAAADLARAGRHVVLATGTASGKSLGYLLPAATAVAEGAGAPSGRGATVLYLSPTKALAQDQLRVLRGLDVPGLRPAAYDGDTPPDEREWVRAHATWVLTNPDMLHRSVLPGHARWSSFLRALRYVVVDEVHGYRGVFGSHVAQVLRRLRRVCARYGADPVVVLASATVADPAASAGRLTGLPVEAVTDDGSPRGGTAFALWEPPLAPHGGEGGAPVRRTTTAEAADLLADLVVAGTRTLAFVRSRRGAEAVAMTARRLLEDVDPSLPGRVAAYRGGYLPEERRALEAALQRGDLLGVATTNALELGLDVSGLDAVLLAGWPGTRASLWQQAGRAGRAGQQALAVLIGREDPLDTYLVHHPEAVFGRPVEATVLDPDNPYVLAPHLCAAAAELPLREEDLPLFGPAAPAVLDALVAGGRLRRRPGGWYWTRRERACDLADLRGTGGPPVRLCEPGTGRMLGTVDAGASHSTVHEGAVYVHQGETWLVRSLDLEDHVALLERAEPDHTTTAREVTDIRVLGTSATVPWGRARLSFGSVEVTHQVVAYLRRRVLTGEVLGEVPLDLPPRHLRTRAVWWTVDEDQLAEAGLAPGDVAGAAHAAEHASIGLLPLVATCDRWDVGGVSTPLHEDTGRATVFVYDGHPGGAGFAERGFAAAQEWLRATRDVIRSCGCEAGCPSCVQSPKCGNGNEPLDKAGAVRLLDVLLAGAAHGAGDQGADEPGRAAQERVAQERVAAGRAAAERAAAERPAAERAAAEQEAVAAQHRAERDAGHRPARARATTEPGSRPAGATEADTSTEPSGRTEQRAS
ncbi:DEAD/DEAH box helicase [Vallicoccus soli]|uniref:DEAD/DEAH box helicase n=1 Tax=Vallicoccus soli TaxID=2339232 RepID=UPI001FE771B0|nr:DEAD/DEAH box helicase [Vallicoccus soli]